MTSLALFALMLLQPLAQRSDGSITGQLLNGSGSPAASVRVSIAPVNDREPNLSVLTAFAVTDSSGRFRIENVDPGTYYVIAGLVAQPTYYPGVAASAGARAVTVAEGAAITGIDFRIVTSLTGPAPRPPNPGPALATLAANLAAANQPPMFSIAGSIALKPGQKLPMNLLLFPSPGSLITVPVRPDGSFEVSGRIAGPYWFWTTPSLRSVTPHVVVVDKDVKGVTVTIPLSGFVTGKIEPKAGPLTAPLSLRFVDTADSTNRIAVSSADTFEVELPEGEYRVTPEKLPEGYVLESLSIDNTRLQGETFKIAPDARVHLVVTVAAGARSTPPAPSTILREVSGRIEKEGSVTGGLVGLRFSDASGPRATVLLDTSFPNPTFRVALPAGEYKVEAMLPAAGNQPNPLRIKSATYRSTDILSMPLRITEESTGEIRVVIENLR